MKQGKVVYRALSAICFAGLLCYLLYYIYNAAENPLQTAYAIEFEAYDSYSVAGIIARDEQVIYSNQPLVTITRREGEKVGSNQKIAVTFKDDDARERRAKVEDLELRVSQLESTLGTTVEVLDGVKLDEAITNAILSMNKSVQSRSLSSVESQSASLKTLIFNREYTYSELGELEDELYELSSELAALKSISSSETGEVRTLTSGVYSAYVDGYERVLSSTKLTDMTVEEFYSLSPLTEDTDSSIGKVITSTRWYFVTVMDEDKAKQLGKTALVRFNQDYTADISMNVERVAAAVGGKSLVVLSSSERLSDMTLLRKQTVDIIFNSYSGIRIMKKAIRFDEEGNAGVYCLEGLNAVFKKVDIIYETGDFYIVESDKLSTSKLWAGNEVIIAGKDLFDGKVVSR